MSLPAKLYNTFRQIQKSALVTRNDYTESDIVDFVALLNSAQPKEGNELVQYMFARSMFNSNKESYIKYISNKESNVSALILWTESKVIVRYFGIQQKVYLGWDSELKSYIYEKFDESKRKPFEFKAVAKKPHNEFHIPHVSKNYTVKVARTPRAIHNKTDTPVINQKTIVETIDESINSLQAKLDKLRQSASVELEIKAEPIKVETVKVITVNAALVNMRKKNKNKASKTLQKPVVAEQAPEPAAVQAAEPVAAPAPESHELDSNPPTPTVPIPADSVAE